ncbi:hypothetical protein HG536_0B00580 [Torulaspora globosa]|uniref:VHS domain-containing protein n=1 Tax=Torulaspora globosa TaxID=48254 RepID=A0A7G3ZCG1_9SACH|nr:uncharacterized protein HG536_0B00580 [Torulaspora globosa]QLL31197.1 hypothetical protein HG536_0B00580 [Torulaspora globosa]
MGLLSDHPHTAITDTIDRVVSTKEYALEVDLGTVVGLIRNGASDYEYITNQREAARVLRKKLKYGNRLQQSRSLDLLDLFVSQGIRFGALYNDDKLVDRLSGIALNRVPDSRGSRYNSKIVKKCANYVLSWCNYIEESGQQSNRSYASFVELGRSVKRRYSNAQQRRGRSNFMDDQADESIHASQQSDPDQLYGIPRIDIKKSAPAMRVVISDALAAAVALKNALMVLPQGKSSTDDEEATARFIQARALRRKILRYLQLVTEGEFLGSLIHANDELVSALAEYDEKSAESAESSSEELYSDEDGDGRSSEDDYDSRSLASTQPSTASNPFGDHNKI